MDRAVLRQTQKLPKQSHDALTFFGICHRVRTCTLCICPFHDCGIDLGGMTIRVYISNHRRRSLLEGLAFQTLQT